VTGKSQLRFRALGKTSLVRRRVAVPQCRESAMRFPEPKNFLAARCPGSVAERPASRCYASPRPDAFFATEPAEA
jgi:hypothetical protein